MAVQKIKERIFVDVDYEGANVACIQTDQGLVQVDTPMLARDIDHWKDFVLSLDPKGIKYIINTHRHFEHVVGNRRLGGIGIMQTMEKEELLHPKGPPGALKAALALFPSLTEGDKEFILSEPRVPPEIVIQDELTLSLGNCTLKVFHVGGHTRGSLAVYILEDKVLLTGDNITAGMHPVKVHAGFAEWIQALKRMKSLETEIVVPGHGPVCGKEELSRSLEYFQRLWLMAEDFVKQGMSRDQVVTEVHNRMIPFYNMDPNRIQGIKNMFDMGTRRLYDEVLGLS